MELFEAAKNDRVECLDTQSKPPRCSEFVVSVLSNQGWTVVCLCQCTVELILQKRGLNASSVDAGVILL